MMITSRIDDQPSPAWAQITLGYMASDPSGGRATWFNDSGGQCPEPHAATARNDDLVRGHA